MDFNSPVIDPRNEDTLTQQAKARAYQLSGGQLNSFAEGDPLDALIRTQCYAAAEMLFYASQLPLAFAIKFLTLAGVQRSVGAKAIAPVTFTLVSPRGTNFRIPKGFEILASARNQTLSFFTTEDLIIPPGATQGTVTAEAEAIGTTYNVAAGRLNRVSQPLAFLQSVTNLQAAQGGLDEESDESAIQRGIAALRRRNPVSGADYEEYAEEILGYGSRVKAIGLLGADKATFEKGAVHLFALSAEGQPANQSQIAKLTSELSTKIQLGTRLHISPMGVKEVYGVIIASIEQGESPDAVADNLWEVYQEALSPLQFEVGGSVEIEEIGHQLRFAGGVKYLEEVRLNGEGIDVPMPNKYTLPVPFSLRCKLVDSAGAVFDLLRGSGELPADYTGV